MAGPSEIDPEVSANENEGWVLGSILAGAIEFDSVARELRHDDFVSERHQRLYRAMLALHDRQEPIDAFTVAQELAHRRQLSANGGATYLLSLTQGLPILTHPERYVWFVKQAAILRAVARASETISGRATRGNETADSLLTDAVSLFQKLQGRNGNHAETATAQIDIDSIPAIHSYKSRNLEFAVERLFAMGCVTLVSGESGCGKTTLTTAAAAEILRGGEFAGRECTRRKVLILDRENPIEVVKERFERLGITDSGLLVWGGWLEKEPPAINAPVVREWVVKTEPKPFITLDTAVTFLEGDENSATDVRKFMEGVREIANLGAGVVLLHHSGKAETAKDYRGSSYFKGGSDVAYQMVNFGEGELTKVRLKAFKSRFTVDRDIVLDYHNGAFIPDTRLHAPLRTLTEQLTALLAANPRVTKAEFENLAAARKLGRNQARTYIDNGVSMGEIVVTFGPKNTHYYQLKPDGGIIQ